MRVINREEIATAMDLFDMLGEKSGCKRQAGTIVRSLVAGYVHNQVGPKPHAPYLTDAELEWCRKGRKISAIKLVRDRKPHFSLIESKRYVEKHGAEQLATAEAERISGLTLRPIGERPIDSDGYGY